ncbi:TonB-dependent receptor [Nitrosovibrio tenuis]|uniref:Iron complex outermembrane recepter protein n=1 Tax=Nitrosovibrio tenuis TaxID=1233 RepID=A0A1H7GEI8_9PROT|nr:TonB-dependent receptor [Nitrosovibrio tenuis]SEK36541.1 iron complex outermembrane recepter protein [Nitrosovibrio tenuis]
MKHFAKHKPKFASMALLAAGCFMPVHASADDKDSLETKNALPEVKVTTGRVRPGTLEDVARTGSKTDTPLRDIPASVAVVPATLLREQGVINMNDAMRNVSSVQPLMGGGYGFANNFTSRGLPLSFFRDDMPDGTSPQNGYYRTMYDVERIEVLKGPGSALFGVAGPGGSINMITRQPRSAFAASAGTMLGSFGTRIGYLDATGPIGQSFAGRFITDLEHADGFRGLKRDIFEISPSLMWRLADDKTLLIDFDHREIKIKPDNYGTLFNFNSQLVVPRENRYYSPFNNTSNTINRVTAVHNWAISADLNMRTAFTYDGRSLDLVRNGGGNQANAAGIITGRDARHQTDHQAFATFQNEFIWKTNTGPVKHTFLGGFEYKNTDITTVRADYTLPNAVSLFNPNNLETSLDGITRRPIFDRRISSDQTSFYAQDQLDLSEQFKLRLGIRNDLVQWSDKGFQSGVGFREIVRSRSLTTYSTGGVYQPTKFLAFYAGYSTGAFVNLSTEPTAVAAAPETSNQIEVGAKTTLLDGKADFNVALFQTSRNNYFITLNPGLNNNQTQDGNDRSRGVEVNLAYRPIAGLSILGNGVWMDPETISRANAINNVLGINRSIFGNRPVGVATNMGNLWTTYQIQTGLAQGLTFGFGVTYKGDSFADTLNLLRVPSYVVYDAAISYRIKKLEVAVNVKNLTDKTYYTNPTFAGALPGDSRSAFGSIRFYFN